PGNRWLPRHAATRRTTVNKDQVSGKVEQALGKVKQSVGETVGNEKLANQGVVDQAKGAAKETWRASCCRSFCRVGYWFRTVASRVGTVWPGSRERSRWLKSLLYSRVLSRSLNAALTSPGCATWSPVVPSGTISASSARR